MYLGRTIERPRVHSTAALTPPAPVRTVVVSISGEQTALLRNSDVAFVDEEAIARCQLPGEAGEKSMPIDCLLRKVFELLENEFDERRTSRSSPLTGAHPPALPPVLTRHIMPHAV
jgi:hypothetical protein